MEKSHLSIDGQPMNSPDGNLVAIHLDDHLHDGSRVLIIGFSGEYRSGSSGNPDADFMIEFSELAVESCNPAAVIFDFSKLKYEWGDMLEAVYSAAPTDTATGNARFAVVVGPHCADAIRTLELGELSDEPLSSIPWVHSNISSAHAYLCGVAL